VSAVKKIWAGEGEAARQVLIASAVAVAAGIALIVVGVVEHWGQTQLPGALLITVGGSAGGAAIGLSPPLRTKVWSRLMTWRVKIAIVAAIIIATPAVLAMASATFGPVAGGGDAQDTALVILGVLIGLIFMVGTILAAVIAVRATRERANPLETNELQGDQA
jgi:hypothetical protein